MWKGFAYSFALALSLVSSGCTDQTVDLADGDASAEAPPDLLGVTACKPDTRECVSDTLARLCPADGAGWLAVPCAKGEKCSDGACQPDPDGAPCTPGDGTCSDAGTALRCRSSGVGYEVVSCPEGTTCGGNGLCAGTCVVGESRCDGLGTLSTCTDGHTFVPAACPAGQACAVFAQAPNGLARCIPASECLPDPSGCDTVCGNRLDPSADQSRFTSSCVATASGFKWQVTGCLAPATCSPTASACAASSLRQAGCASECAPGEQRCSGLGLQTCTDEGSWGAVTPCDHAKGEVCFADPTHPAQALCGDADCATGAKGLCVLDGGVTKLRTCQGGHLAAADQLTTCTTGLCLPDLTVATPPTGHTPGACQTECQTGDSRCVPVNAAGRKGFQVCANGAWDASTTGCPTGLVCFDSLGQSGRPAAVCGTCQPGTHRCTTPTGGDDGGVDALSGIETCGANGLWGEAAACALGRCFALDGGNDALCQAECIPSAQTRCTGAPQSIDGLSDAIAGTSASQSCGPDGRFQPETACAEGTACRTDQAGNGLGCVVCVGGRNENGLTDTRCSNSDGTASGSAGVQTCKPDSSGWATPVKQCGSSACVPPSVHSEHGVTQVYCHSCSMLGIGDCTQSGLVTLGLDCALLEWGAPVSCAAGTLGQPDVGDCCAATCYADTPTPAVCN